MIDRNDVIQAYRLILGREPESEDVVNRYANDIQDVASLRELFIGSIEFRREFEARHAPKRMQRGFHGQEMTVELEANEEQLQALSAKVAAQWKYLGETEPFWSVITQDHYVMGSIESNKDLFYRSGEQEIQYFESLLKRHKLWLNGEGRCLELGCGVGRATGALAKRFREVVAFDISQPHIQLARQALSDHDNVDFVHLTELQQTASFSPIDCFYSKIVLQHNPPPVMAVLLKNIFNSLVPGGVGHFQIPVYKAGYQFHIDRYLKQENETNMEMHYFPQDSLFELITQADCRVLELYEDESTGNLPYALSNTLLIQKRG